MINNQTNICSSARMMSCIRLLPKLSNYPDICNLFLTSYDGYGKLSSCLSEFSKQNCNEMEQPAPLLALAQLTDFNVNNLGVTFSASAPSFWVCQVNC